MKTAVITGIGGQTGSYLADLLLQKGYQVHGLVRTSSHPNPMVNISHILDDANLHLHTGNICDYSVIQSILKEVQPDEVYHMAAKTHVGESFLLPFETINTNILGSVNILEGVRTVSPFSKLYMAGSSEMVGSGDLNSTEETRFHPNSPYACGKVFAYDLAINFRESYNLFICNGIAFNHESPRRGEEFVTRKVTRAVARIKLGIQDKLTLGNLNTSRDWGAAWEFAEAMWMMLQHDIPDDYVICTGQMYSLKQFLEVAFNYVELNWEDYVQCDQSLIRPKDNDKLLGDHSKITRVLGWEPKVSFEELVHMMVRNDIQLTEKELK